jgi:hypothetical protein
MNNCPYDTDGDGDCARCARIGGCFMTDCEVSGHEWVPMGGGMDTCMRCQKDRLSPDG